MRYSNKYSGNNNKRKTEKSKIKANAKESAESKRRLKDGMKMASIEAYAKKHGISVTKAMIHLMW